MRQHMPNFIIVEHTAEKLVIQDVGPWSRHLTITNGAEDVVEQLLGNGQLRPGMRLFYFDSEGMLDELRHDGQRFTGFAPGPRPTAGD